MKKKIFTIGLLACFTLVFNACKNEETKVDNESDPEISAMLDEVRAEHAPDKRVALLNIETANKDGKLLLKGESNLPDAVEDLKAKLKEKDIQFIDSIQLLPQGEIKNTPKAVVKISVANLRSNPAHSAELATQATMGTPLNVLKTEDTWYLVQTPDKYLAWVDQGGITLLTQEKFEEWKKAEKLIFTKTYGTSYEKATETSQVVSDLVAGDVLEKLKEEKLFYQVKYPNGDTAYVNKKEMKPLSEWVKSLKASEDNLVSTSKSLMGLPYLWGGTSSKGVDCSGFTKTVYFLNGIVLPRDASQQVHTGKLVDSTRNFKNLIPGDLLFFGRPATDSTSEKVVHVGMWIGNNQFIHALGNVHISTVDTTSPDFDKYNYDRYLRTKRITDQSNNNILRLTNTNLYN